MTTIRRVPGAVLFLVLLSSAAFAGAEFSIKARGKHLATLDLEALKAKGGARELTVHDINENKEITFKAIPFNALMSAVYGSRWKEAEEVLFTCTDGYQPSLPRGLFDSYDAYLAFERKGDSGFGLTNELQHGKRVALGPFYLVWDTKKQPQVLKESPDYWPYQIATVDLVRFSERFPQLYPPAGASKAALRGFAHFRAQCMTCHAMNGQGGKAGPELNYPTNVTEMLYPAALRRWLSDPYSMRWKTIMPGVPANLPGREKVIDDVIAYLKAMRSKKVRPPEPAQ